jgi:hypothetical protein
MRVCAYHPHDVGEERFVRRQAELFIAKKRIFEPIVLEVNVVRREAPVVQERGPVQPVA